jgi:hypothetical protein
MASSVSVVLTVIVAPAVYLVEEVVGVEPVVPRV